MGRVLNYSIKKDSGNFTRKEIEAMFEISKRYNSKEMLADINEAYGTKLKELWSCESFWLGFGSYYPNWGHMVVCHKTKTWVKNSWEYVEKHMSELKKTMPEIDAILQAKKDGVINFLDEDYKNSFHGFTKVQGNEFNSLLVFKALIEISKRIPKATLRVSDEGEFLLCPLKIKNGLVLPEISDLIENIQYYSMLMMLSKNYEGNILNKLKNTEFKNECFKGDVHIENNYGDMSNYIDNSLRNLQEIEKVLMSVTEKDNDLFIYNINNRNPKDWFNPMLFVRPVDVKDFLSYKRSPATMMDGFHGSYWNLTDKDEEAESYRMLANIFGMLEKAGFDKNNVKTLGTDY
jgi:hypothetical protein